MGDVYLAQRTGAPIIPVAMHGTGNLMGADGRLRPFHKVRIRAGNPVWVPEDAGYRARGEALEELRLTMQGMYTDLRRIAGSHLVQSDREDSEITQPLRASGARESRALDAVHALSS